MKILYKQHSINQRTHSSCLDAFGITRCYFKEISFVNDSNLITKKSHHHTGFEIHIISDGYQTYEIDGKIHKLEAGNFILIPPHAEHRILDSTQLVSKHSITFDSTEKTNITNYTSGKVPKRIQENILAVKDHKKSTNIIIENIVFEIIIIILRLCGYAETPETTDLSDVDSRISIAKQYISDNIEQALTTSDVAQYCNLSPKQITRLFLKDTGMSPISYIHSRRIFYIEELLKNSSFSLKEISEIMNFHNEYYFNAFFKKYSGIPPGEYRKVNQ